MTPSRITSTQARRAAPIKRRAFRGTRRIMARMSSHRIIICVATSSALSIASCKRARSHMHARRSAGGSGRAAACWQATSASSRAWRRIGGGGGSNRGKRASSTYDSVKRRHRNQRNGGYQRMAAAARSIMAKKPWRRKSPVNHESGVMWQA